MKLLKSLLSKKIADKSLPTTAVAQLSAKELHAVAGGRRYYRPYRVPFKGRQDQDY